METMSTPSSAFLAYSAAKASAVLSQDARVLMARRREIASALREEESLPASAR
jgi:hypothetical protein